MSLGNAYTYCSYPFGYSLQLEKTNTFSSRPYSKSSLSLFFPLEEIMQDNVERSWAYTDLHLLSWKENKNSASL